MEIISGIIESSCLKGRVSRLSIWSTNRLPITQSYAISYKHKTIQPYNTYGTEPEWGSSVMRHATKTERQGLMRTFALQLENVSANERCAATERIILQFLQIFFCNDRISIHIFSYACTHGLSFRLLFLRLRGNSTHTIQSPHAVHVLRTPRSHARQAPRVTWGNRASPRQQPAETTELIRLWPWTLLTAVCLLC